MAEHDVKYFDNRSKAYEEWSKDGKRHREDGPAYIWYNLDGTKAFEKWHKDGEYHREDGPALISYFDNGSKEYEYWCKDDKIHREDGPARISYNLDGTKDYEWWYLHDQEYTESEHKELLELCKTIITRDAAIMNIKHPSEYIKRKCQEILNGRV
jgi:hypothetical protein